MSWLDFFDKGKYGERLTERELKWVRFFGRDGKILRNVYIPKGNGQTSEIDVLYITEKGIFVFESKNYSGWIFGDEQSRYWTAMLPNKEKNRFYNPIMQNKSHIKWLRNYIGDRIPFFSIIVFSERCELRKVSAVSAEVIKRDYMYHTVKKIWESTDSVLSEVEVNDIYEKLLKLTNVDKKSKAEHIENIKNRCPRCGGELILRTSRKDGTQFYGCSNFPNCRYTRSV